MVVVAAALLYLSPADWWASFQSAPAGPDASAAAASAPAASEPTTSVVAVAVPDSAAPMPAASASAASMEEANAAEAPASAAAEAPAGLAVLSASDASWVEVIDADGKVLVQRVLRPGESLGLDGRLPFKLKIGNAAATQLQFRGQVVDLTALTRDNVARLELK